MSDGLLHTVLIYGNHFLGGASGTNWFHFFLSADMETTACWHTRMFSILPSLADVAELAVAWRRNQCALEQFIDPITRIAVNCMQSLAF